MSFIFSLYKRVKRFFPSDPEFASFIYSVTGVRPSNLSLYQQAFRHQSKYPGCENNNERMELLGDSVIDFFVCEYLYKKYPYKDEGFLSNLRSKIVNRSQLNELGKRMGLLEKLEYNRRSFNGGSTDLAGNTFEALTGAIYLDAGPEEARRFVQQRVLLQLLDVQEIQSENKDYKSRLYHYVQKNAYSIEYKTVSETLKQGRSFFVIHLLINGKQVSEGEGFNKKSAEQIASKKAFELLDIQDDPND